MCEPVTMAVIGGGQAALGAIGQNQAIKARNKNRAKLYGRDLARIHGEHLVNVSRYYLRGADAEIAWDDNMLAAAQQTDEQQVIMNERIAEALLQTESDYVKMISDPRIAKSLERTGQTARRASIAGKAAIGRAKAARRGQIDRQRDRSLSVLQRINQERRRADRDAQRQIGFEPQRAADPPKPVFEKGPSLFSTLTKIALGAAQGYLMGNELKQAGLFQSGGGKLIEGAGKNLTTSATKGLAKAGTRYSSGVAGLRAAQQTTTVVAEKVASRTADQLLSAFAVGGSQWVGANSNWIWGGNQRDTTPRAGGR